MRCVFDTNVLISALLIPASLPRQSLDIALGSGRVLTSIALISEIHAVLTRKDFSRYIDEEDAFTFIAALTREAELIEVNVSFTACRDPKDNMLLELAVSGRATHLITGDADLLALHPFQGIEVVSPRDFLQSARR